MRIKRTTAETEVIPPVATHTSSLSDAIATDAVFEGRWDR